MHLFCLSVCTDDEVLNSPSHSPVGRRTRVPSKTLRKGVVILMCLSVNV